MTLPHSPVGCPMDSLLRLLMGPWTTYILYILKTQGAMRFGALKRAVPGISARLLTERLRLLESAEIVTREYEPSIPPAVTYALAPRGLELSGVLDQLSKIAVKWRDIDAKALKKRGRKAA